MVVGVGLDYEVLGERGGMLMVSTNKMAVVVESKKNSRPSARICKDHAGNGVKPTFLLSYLGSTGIG